MVGLNPTPSAPIFGRTRGRIQVRYGVCKLTGERGPFIKAHLIPRALTKPKVSGNCLVQFGLGQRPVRRHSSWYDEELVTGKGEEILAAYDNWAVNELRRHRLVWSSQGATRLPAGGGAVPLGWLGYGLRRVYCSDPGRLRLFFLSLLWRAAQTTRPEFQTVRLPPDDLETLRMMVRWGRPGPVAFYPATLLQLTPVGPVHNHAPNARDETYKCFGQIITWSSFRFYFDGLVANVHRPRPGHAGVFETSLTVGYDNVLILMMQDFRSSFQLSNLRQSMMENFLQWPQTTRRFFNIPSSRDYVLEQHSQEFGYGLPWTKPKE